MNNDFRITISYKGIKQEVSYKLENQNIVFYSGNKKIEDKELIEYLKQLFRKLFGKNSFNSLLFLRRTFRNLRTLPLVKNNDRKQVNVIEKGMISNKKKRIASKMFALLLASTLLFSPMAGCAETSGVTQSSIVFDATDSNFTFFEKNEESNLQYVSNILENSEFKESKYAICELLYQRFPNILTRENVKKIDRLNIVKTNDVGYLGYYIPSDNTIYLNSDAYEQLMQGKFDSTVLHEFLHIFGEVTTDEIPFYVFENASIVVDKYSGVNEGIAEYMTMQLLGTEETETAYAFEVQCIKRLIDILGDESYLIDAFLKKDINILKNKMFEFGISEKEQQIFFGKLDAFLMLQHEVANGTAYNLSFDIDCCLLEVESDISEMLDVFQTLSKKKTSYY